MEFELIVEIPSYAVALCTIHRRQVESSLFGNEMISLPVCMHVFMLLRGQLELSQHFSICILEISSSH